MRRSALKDGEPVAEDPAVPVCARTAEKGSKDAAATPSPAASNLRRSGNAGPPVSISLWVGYFMLVQLHWSGRPFDS
jgi:hypothetical protein